MNLHYLILSVDEKECAITVRYFTDVLTEQMLTADPADTADQPVRCRTDYQLNLWRPDMSEDEVEDLILRSAPTTWLMMMEGQRAGVFKGTLGAAKKLAQKSKRTVSVSPLGTIDWPKRQKPVLPKS
jgi:hypothetical protein